MKILVCGGRDFKDVKLLIDTLDGIKIGRGVDLLIHGGAQGADTLAGIWAEMKGIAVKKVPADWKKYGRAAGPIRNSEMLKLNPDLVVAFPGGVGTTDMVVKASKAGIEIIVVGEQV